MGFGSTCSASLWSLRAGSSVGSADGFSVSSASPSAWDGRRGFGSVWSCWFFVMTLHPTTGAAVRVAEPTAHFPRIWGCEWGHPCGGVEALAATIAEVVDLR